MRQGTSHADRCDNMVERLYGPANAGLTAHRSARTSATARSHPGTAASVTRAQTHDMPSRAPVLEGDQVWHPTLRSTAVEDKPGTSYSGRCSPDEATHSFELVKPRPAATSIAAQPGPGSDS